MLFRRLRERRHRERVAHALYVSVVEQSRATAFYQAHEVPDTVDGRFDLLAIHAFLAMRRLGHVEGGRAGEAKELSQALFDLMFADMDQNLREMGVTDLAVGRKVHKMAEAFYGRINAYELAFADGDDALAAAVVRNLYRKADEAGERHAAAMAAYIRRADQALTAGSDANLLDGRLSFPALEV